MAQPVVRSTPEKGAAEPVARRPSIAWSSEWTAAFGSSLMLFAAFPPCNLWLLAWIAPIGWLRLIRQADWRMHRPYRMLYAAGFLHWLLLVHWIRLPHWSAYFGWLTLAAYLAIYIPLFVAISRVLVHRWRWPVMGAAPIVWTGLEYARGYLLTGFSMSLLGHTQLPFHSVVQIADVVGAYGVSFVVMWVAACAAQATASPFRSARAAYATVAAASVVLACVAYGVTRVQSIAAEDVSTSPLRVALIQGALDTQFDGDSERVHRAFLDYAELTRQAVIEHDDLDFVIWPESMFTGNEPMVTHDSSLVVAAVPDWPGTRDELRRRLHEYEAGVRGRFKWMAQQIQLPMLVGMEWDHYQADDLLRFNSAVFLDSQGEVAGRYDKTHPVMFGEYVPFGNWMRWLYRLTPMSSGLEPGEGPRVFTIAGCRFSPTICFENTVPHLVRRQVKQLAQQDRAPDVLVTISNDGWFWGSSLLDVHLACGAFRAIELRKPMLIAANTGFSAWIDATGSVRRQGPRRQEAVLIADVAPAPHDSAYLRYGDWFAGACLGVTVAGVISSSIARLRR